MTTTLLAPLPAPTTTHKGVSYRPDIDGLRAIAVCAVVLYHAGFATFGGGFVGVDVFFVISGYLIMSVIAVDIDNGRFSLIDFYERRTRRIFPALIVVVAFCCAVALLLFPPTRCIDFAKSLVAAAFSVSNFYFRGIAQSKGYFDADSELQLLLHTWSLAVEEQFYLLLPTGLIVLRRFKPAATIPVLAALAAASLAWAAYTVTYKPNYTFYIVFPRAWEMLAGSLLALKVLPRRVPAIVREGAAVLGLGLILTPIFLYSDQTVFPGLSALPPVVGTCLVIYAGAGTPSTVGKALAWRPFVAIGLISYSFYLWHWPLMVAARYVIIGTVAPGVMVGVVGASFLLAILSYHFVEKPFRGRRARLSRAGVFKAGGAAIGLASLFGAIVLVEEGLPGGFSPTDRTALAANVERAGENSNPKCLNWGKRFDTIADVELCPIDPSADARRVLFWGDSHVAQFRPLVETLAHEGFFGDRDIAFATAGGCPPARGVNHVGAPYHCPDFTRYAWQLVQDPRVDLVFFGFSAWFEHGDEKVCAVGADGSCGRILSGEEVAEKVATTVRTLGPLLRKRHVRFVVMLPAPSYDMKIPDFEMKRLSMRKLSGYLDQIGVRRSLERFDFDMSRRIIETAAQEVGATIFDPRDVLCERGKQCVYQRDDVSIYTDSTHIASSQIGMFHDAMAAAFRQVMAER